MKNKVTQRVNSNSKKSILNAAEVILNGGIIVYPTDTLYGFGVDANNISAINKLNNNKSKVSSHYFIKRTGEIILMVPELYIAATASASKVTSHIAS